MPLQSESPLLLDVQDAAALLGVTPKHLYDLAARREVPHVRIGRYVRFRREGLIAWIEASEIAPETTARR